MRPLFLELCGFGTYCNKTEINLQLLGESGLYLICGDTGAGKSTIFDAISYALFGHSSGENKSESMLRSTFAKPENETYVKLIFEHDGKKYTVKRNPSYIRKALKGNGFAKENAAAYIQCDGMTDISGITEVNDFIKNLIGLEQKQFAQIVMIAQGEFQQILFAETKERIPVYRKLFKTEKYQQLQDRLSKETSEIKVRENELNIQASDFLKMIICDENEPLSVLLQDAKLKELPCEETISIINQIIEKDSRVLKEKQKEEKKISEKIEKLAGDISVQLTKKENIIKLQDSKKEKNIFEEKEKIYKTEFELNSKKLEEKKNIENESAILNNKLKDYDIFDSKNNELEKDQLMLEENKKNLITLEKVNSENKKNLDEFNIKIKELDGVDKDFIVKENAINQKQNELQAIKLLLEKFNNYLNNRHLLSTKQKEYEDLSKKYEEDLNIYLHSKKIFMDNQAGILAKELKDNQPCPVCGSVHHPLIAKVSSKTVTKEDLDTLDLSAKESEKKMNQINLEAASLNTSCKELQTIIEEEMQKSKLDIKIDFENSEKAKESISEKKSEIELEIKNLMNEFNALKDKIALKEELSLKIQEITNQLEADIEKYNQIKEQHIVLKEKITNEENSINELKQNLQFENKKSAEKYIEQLNQKIASINKAFEESQRNLQECQKKIASLDEVIKLLENQTNDFSLEVLETMENQKCELEKEQQELNLRLTKINTRLDTNSKVLKNFEKNSKELNEVRQKYQMINALSKTANGSVGNGKYKIQLETYVQMAFLDKVIALANKRLNIMSDGQYDLIRKMEGEDKVSFSGLDIDVIDHYNGGQRNVKSLSGGESFEASLSLALGLSDVIANYAHGVKIDTMFIDEGFGTLDNETLQKAFKALTSISENNDKLIGIISHVDLLKEKIQRQIRVSKTVSEGSNVQIIS